MTIKTIGGFREVWLVDFEFGCKDGDTPDPVCLVAKKLGSEVTFRLWEDEIKFIFPSCTTQLPIIIDIIGL